VKRMRAFRSPLPTAQGCQEVDRKGVRAARCGVWGCLRVSGGRGVLPRLRQAREKRHGRSGRAGLHEPEQIAYVLPRGESLAGVQWTK
jgi:hypothetical protein